MPYCSSDIHQGHNGPSPETGEFIFNGQTILIEMLERLKDFHNLSNAKRVILNGSSSGGKGTAGNCNLMGDFLKNLNTEIEFKCIADAAGWIPLPVYNTEECDNDARELSSTALWNRQVDEICSDLAHQEGLNNVTSCSFETQYAKYIRYPIMFTGTMQDQIFLERHFCQKPWDSISANKLSWWIKAINEVTEDYIVEHPEIGFWLTSCPSHGQLYGAGAGGWNPNKVRGITIDQAMAAWALDGERVHFVDSIDSTNSFCPDGFCKAIRRRSQCGLSSISKEDCAKIGCAWCPENSQPSCVSVIL